MRVVNPHTISDCSQSSIGGIEKCIRTHIILRSYPFSLQYPPKRFSYIQMRGVWRQIENEQTSFLPNRSQLFNLMITMNRCIIQHHKGVFTHLKGESIKKFDNLVRVNTLGSCKTLVIILAVNHTKYVQSCASLGCNAYILPRQLPTVGNVPFGTNVTFICIVEVNTSLTLLFLKFLQLLILILVELRRGYSPWAFSYTLISCANADKKRLKVKSLTTFPVACCQATLALLTLCLSCSIAKRTACSSEQSIIGLRPRPGRVSKPAMPSVRKRFTHEFTDTKLISVWSPAFAEDKPSPLRRTARQRIRKQWLVPWRKPFSSAEYWTFVNSNFFIFPIYYHKYFNEDRTERIREYFI